MPPTTPPNNSPPPTSPPPPRPPLPPQAPPLRDLSLEPGQAFVRRTAHCRFPTPSRQAQEDKGVKCVAAVPVTQQKRLENRGSTGTGRSLQGSGPCPTRRNIGFRARLQRIALSMSFVSKGFAEEIVPVPGRALGRLGHVVADEEIHLHELHGRSEEHTSELQSPDH